MIKKGMMLTVWLLLSQLSSTIVYAQLPEEELPVIVLWQDGYAYQEDCTQITGSWAYDAVNPAGKYVLFAEDGTVLRKTENMNASDISNDYTGTELNQATAALRAETFEEFHGIITVVLEERSGLQRLAELTEGNFWSLNLPMNSGTYCFKEVTAKEGECCYKTEYSSEPVLLSEQAVCVMKVRVLNEAVPVPEPVLEEAQPETEVSMTEVHIEQQIQTEEGKEAHIMHESGLKKAVALAGGIITVALAGIWLWWKKRKRYG